MKRRGISFGFRDPAAFPFALKPVVSSVRPPFRFPLRIVSPRPLRTRSPFSRSETAVSTRIISSRGARTTPFFRLSTSNVEQVAMLGLSRASIQHHRKRSDGMSCCVGECPTSPRATSSGLMMDDSRAKRSGWLSARSLQQQRDRDGGEFSLRHARGRSLEDAKWLTEILSPRAGRRSVECRATATVGRSADKINRQPGSSPISGSNSNPSFHIMDSDKFFPASESKPGINHVDDVVLPEEKSMMNNNGSSTGGEMMMSAVTEDVEPFLDGSSSPVAFPVHGKRSEAAKNAAGGIIGGTVWATPLYRPRSPESNVVSARPLSPSRIAPDTLKLYSMQEGLGVGAYGTVFKAIEVATGRPVAVKKINLAAGHCCRRRIEQEVEMLRDLRVNKGVARVYETFEERKNLYIVMELCSGGDLRKFIMEEGRLRETQVALVAFQILLLLRDLHQKQIVHGDVKPANFVIANKMSYHLFKRGIPFLTRGWLKAVDFGCSQHTGVGRIHHKIGTPSHWAPEVFGQNYHIESDMWSLGVTLYELISGRLPFCDNMEERNMRCERELLRALVFKQPDFSYGPWKTASPEIIDFMKSLLTKEYKKRMTVQQALDHPWVRKHQRWCRSVAKGADMVEGQSWAVPQFI